MLTKRGKILTAAKLRARAAKKLRAAPRRQAKRLDKAKAAEAERFMAERRKALCEAPADGLNETAPATMEG